MKRVDQGSTLIELLVSLTILTILVGLTSATMIDAWRNYFFTQGQIELTEQLIRAGDRIEQMLLTATDLPQTVILDGVTYTADSTTLIATLPSIDASGASLETTDTLIYDVTDEGLVEILNPGSGSRSAHNQILLGSNLRSVSFTTQATSGSRIHPLLLVTLTAEAELPNNTIERTENRSLVLRNVP